MGMELLISFRRSSVSRSRPVVPITSPTFLSRHFSVFFKVALADVKSIATSKSAEAGENESQTNTPLASIPATSPESSPMDFSPGLSIAEH